MTNAAAPDATTLDRLETATLGHAPSLADMIVEAEKTVRERVRGYPAAIDKGRLTLERAAAKLTAMRRIADTLRWLEANEGWIRDEAGRRAAQVRMRAEEDALMASEPAVAAVLAAFPGAEVSVRDLAHGDDTTTRDEDEDTHD